MNGLLSKFVGQRYARTTKLQWDLAAVVKGDFERGWGDNL